MYLVSENQNLIKTNKSKNKQINFCLLNQFKTTLFLYFQPSIFGTIAKENPKKKEYRLVSFFLYK
jgi:hypothetical protein